MKKIMSLLLVVALVLGLFGTIGTASAKKPMLDVAASTAGKGLDMLNAMGIIAGYPDGTLRPEGNITRAEFAKIAVLALNKGGSANLLKNAPSQFTDVPVGQWFTGFVNVAVTSGIIRGYAGGTFRPEASISQAEAVTMVLRAMGYNDNLPGTWPLNYVMKAADLAIIGSSFAADALSTRTFVCDATMAMLCYDRATYNLVTKTFADPLAGGGLLSDLDFRLRLGDTAGSYSPSTSKLTLTDRGWDIAVAPGAKVSTGEALTALANKRIDYLERLSPDGTEIVYICVKTPVVAGKVASVDAVNNSLTLADGMVVQIGADCTITKNGAPATVIDVSGSDVTALLGADGKAYNIVAYKLDIDGLLLAKQTVVADGATVTKLIIDGHGEFTVPTTATIVRNGAVATFADLKINDDILLSASGTTAAYIDAYLVTKEAVITSVAVNAAGTAVLSVSFADGTTVANAAGSMVVPGAITVGYKTKFNLDRTGKITAKVAETAAVNTVTGRITAVGTTVTAAGSTSYITLDNGTTYSVAAGATFTRNKAAAVFAGLKADDLARLSLDNAGKVTSVAGYANGLLDLAEIPTVLAPSNLATGAVVMFNGAADRIELAAAGNEVSVTWDVTTGLLSGVDAFLWVVQDATVTGSTTITDPLGETISFIDMACDLPPSLPLFPGYKVVKDGVETTLDSIKVGDKVSAAFTLQYFRVTNDTVFGTTANADITLDASKNPAEIKFDDSVKSVTVTVNGAPVTATIATDGRSATIPALNGGDVVGILATDYAGNTATLSVVAPR